MRIRTTACRSTAYTTEAIHTNVSFFILECQPGTGGWSYRKQRLPISTLFALNVKTLLIFFSSPRLGPKCAWARAHNAHWIIRPWVD